MKKYRHAEAFCMMRYRDEVNGKVELIWNSRDGVTSFLVTSRDGNPAQHVDWHRDQRMEKYIPQIGDRMFVDMTPEIARPLAVKYVDHWWNHREFPMSRRWQTKEAAVDHFIAEWSEIKHGAPGPALIDVTSEVQTAIKARQT